MHASIHAAGRTIVPTLRYRDVSAAIDWLCNAFWFARRLVVPGPKETIMHSELALGNAVVMVSSPKPEYGRVSQQNLTGHSHGLCVFVEDPDAHYQNAKSAGAEIVQDLKDEDYGSRGYMARDPEGHQWYFATYRPGAHWDS